MDGLMNILTTAAQQGEGDKICELIEECGGLDKIEDLQSHENEQVYKKALSIITTFFGEEEEAKETNGEEFAFAQPAATAAATEGGFNF